MERCVYILYFQDTLKKKHIVFDEDEDFENLPIPDSLGK